MTTLSVDVSNIVDGQQIDAADVTTPVNQLKTHLENTLNGIQAFDRLSMGTAEALTIATDAVTATKTHIKVDTEAAAASDDLKTINGGAEGRWITLRIANSARVVTLKHGTGNIRSATGGDYVMNSTDMFAFLVHDGTNWLAVVLPSATLLNIGSPTTLTIASDAVTVTRTQHDIATEAAAATDDLKTINGGSEGDMLVIQPANAGQSIRVVPIKGATGNIILSDSQPRYLITNGPTTTQRSLMLKKRGGRWQEMNPRENLSSPRIVNFWMEKAAAASYASIGLAAGTNAGAGAVTEANDTQTTFVSQAIAATAGTYGGRKSSTFDLVHREHNPRFCAIIKTGADITNMRIWVGLCSAVAPNADTMGAVEWMGFRFSTVVPDTNWQYVTSDGSAQTVIDSGVVVAAATTYKLEILVEPSSNVPYFIINNRYWTVGTANFPAAATNLGFSALAIKTSTTAPATNFAISRVLCEYDANY